MNTTLRPKVIVGVDRSLHGLAALRVAATEAARREVPLFAIRVRTDLGAQHDYAEIDEAFAEALGGLPRGELHRELAVPPVAEALLNRVRRADDLVVVGDGGRGRWRTFWSGSVFRSCLRTARCPILAVPAPEMARGVWSRRGRFLRRPDDVWQRFEEESPLPRG
jgi:nucleotide-binding universal stress UspA family protein